MLKKLVMVGVGFVGFCNVAWAEKTVTPIETKKAFFILSMAVSTDNIYLSNCTMSVGYQEEKDEVYVNIMHSETQKTPVPYFLGGHVEAFVLTDNETHASRLLVRSRVNNPQNLSERINFYFYPDLELKEKITAIIGLRETYKMVNEGTVMEPKITAKWVREENPYFICYKKRVLLQR